MGLNGVLIQSLRTSKGMEIKGMPGKKWNDVFSGMDKGPHNSVIAAVPLV